MIINMLVESTIKYHFIIFLENKSEWLTSFLTINKKDKGHMVKASKI